MDSEKKQNDNKRSIRNWPRLWRSLASILAICVLIALCVYSAFSLESANDALMGLREDLMFQQAAIESLSDRVAILEAYRATGRTGSASAYAQTGAAAESLGIVEALGIMQNQYSAHENHLNFVLAAIGIGVTLFALAVPFITFQINRDVIKQVDETEGKSGKLLETLKDLEEKTQLQLDRQGGSIIQMFAIMRNQTRGRDEPLTEIPPVSDASDDVAQAHYFNAITALEAGILEEALRYIDMALHEKSRNARYLALRANIQIKRKNVSEAESDLVRIEKLDALDADEAGSYAMALAYLSIVQGNAGALKQTVARLEKIAKQYPGNAEIALGLAAGLANLSAKQNDAGAREQTATRLEEIAKEYPGNEQIAPWLAVGLANLSVAQDDVGALKKTVERLAGIAEEYPENEQIALGLVMALVNLGVKQDEMGKQRSADRIKVLDGIHPGIIDRLLKECNHTQEDLAFMEHYLK